MIIFHRGLQCPYCVDHLRRIAAYFTDFKNARHSNHRHRPGHSGLRAGDRGVRRALPPFRCCAIPTIRWHGPMGWKRPIAVFSTPPFVVDRQRRIRLAQTANDPVGRSRGITGHREIRRSGTLIPWLTGRHHSHAVPCGVPHFCSAVYTDGVHQIQAHGQVHAASMVSVRNAHRKATAAGRRHDGQLCGPFGPGGVLHVGDSPDTTTAG